MSYLLGLALLVAGVFLLIHGSRLYNQPRVGDQISLWRGTLLLQGEPPNRLYQRLYQAFKTSLQDRLADGDDAPIEVVLTGMGFGPHRLFAAPSLFASRPLYLLVRYRHLRCYVYAGSTPTGLFVSAWGYSDYHAQSVLLRVLPLRGAWGRFSQQTLFQFDAAHMFTSSVHEILFATLDSCLQDKGLKPMEELEKRPILHEFYRHPFYRDPASLIGGAPGGVGHFFDPFDPYFNHLATAVQRNAAVPPAEKNVPASPVAPPPPPQPLFAMDEGLQGDIAPGPLENDAQVADKAAADGTANVDRAAGNGAVA